MALLILSLCCGGVAAGTSEVVTNRTGCAGQAVQTALAAGLCMYAAGCADGSGAGTTAPGMPPNVLVGEDDWSGVAMLGDDLLPAAPYYRAVLHMRGNLDIVLPQGSEETKIELARAQRVLRSELAALSTSHGMSYAGDLQQVEDIARKQVRVRVLQLHLATYGPCKHGGGRQKNSKCKKKATLAAARAKRKLATVANDATHAAHSSCSIPIPATPERCRTRQCAAADDWLDGSSPCNEHKTCETLPRPKRSRSDVSYRDARRKAANNSTWEQLGTEAKKKRAGQIVTDLLQHAPSDDAFDDMMAHVICNPRLAGSDLVQSTKAARGDDVRLEMFQHVVCVLKQLKSSKSTSTTDGYKVLYVLCCSMIVRGIFTIFNTCWL